MSKKKATKKVMAKKLAQAKQATADVLPEAVVELINAVERIDMTIEGVIGRIDRIVDAVGKSKSVRGL